MGRYEVTGELGRGSMGIVHRAHDVVMGRDVALKTILIPHGLPQEQREEFQERFLREAQAAGRLSHPGIVTVYDFNKDGEEQRPYIAMEYVQGSTLHSLIATEGPLKPEWVLAIGDTLADALETACQAGIIHRDLKPANILVRESDGVAKITDFGIARVNHSELTHAGMTYGSPAYMAPERIRGEQADLRSDLFSLGVILYEALCGKRPFGGDDFTSICYAILNDPPASIRGRVSGLSPAFDAFFATALAKDPADRFQTGAAFRDALEAVRHQQVLYSSGAATMLMQHPVRSQVEAAQAGPLGGDTAGTSTLGGTTWTSGFNAVDEDEAPVLPRRPRVDVPTAEQRPYKRLLYLGSFGLLAVLLCLVVLQGGEAPGIETSSANGSADAGAAVQGAQVEGGSPDVTPQAPAASVTTSADGSSGAAERRPSASGPGVVKPPALEQRPRSLGGASPAATAPPKQATKPVNVARKGAATAPAPASAKPRIEPAAAASLPAAAPPVVEAEPAPVEEPPAAATAAPPAPAVIQLSIKSNVRAGKLELLAGPRPIFSSPLDSDKKGFALAYRRMSGKGEPMLEKQLEIPADTRRLTVRVWSEAKARWYEDGLDLDLAPGEEVAVRVTAGRALGEWLSITRD